ncbi:hypothetical protein Bca52824_000650 [Brassica carinata]|uniref:NAF domain-containing protein n=1 Tax=Brassica carinata TaxID=52824 RepID=A0A8X8BBW2_BRACI|nr:hypothetical protein Bca52824_000650 [Brassica carinata]
MSQRLCKILFRNSIATGEVFPLESEVRGCDECTTGDKVMIELRDSGLFGDVYNKRESTFTSQKPASVVISKLEEVAQRLKLRTRKREAGLFKLECLKEGRKGVLSWMLK